MDFKETLKKIIKNNEFSYRKIKRFFEYFRIVKSNLPGSNKVIWNNNYFKNTLENKGYTNSGSNLIQTEALRKEIPKIIEKYKIKSILDIPCGDFYWMKELDFKDINYIGADIVPDLINKNNKEFTKNNINFKIIDLTSDGLPYSDLIFCRDCLVHLSFEDIFKALKNIKKSKSKYFMNTNFLNKDNNHNIATGSWRTINLCKPPFNFNSPKENILENCSEGKDNEFADKTMSIWEVKLIPNYN